MEVLPEGSGCHSGYDENIDPQIQVHPHIRLEPDRLDGKDIIRSTPLGTPSHVNCEYTGNIQFRCNANGTRTYYLTALFRKEEADEVLDFSLHELQPGDLLICEYCWTGKGYAKDVKKEHWHFAFKDVEKYGTLRRILSLDSRQHGKIRDWQRLETDGTKANALTTYAWIPPSLPAAQYLLSRNTIGAADQCSAPQCYKASKGKISEYTRHMGTHLRRYKCKLCENGHYKRKPYAGSGARKFDVAKHLESGIHSLRKMEKGSKRNQRIPEDIAKYILPNSQGEILKAGIKLLGLESTDAMWICSSAIYESK